MPAIKLQLVVDGRVETEREMFVGSIPEARNLFAKWQRKLFGEPEFLPSKYLKSKKERILPFR